MASYGEFIEETTNSTGTGVITLIGGGQTGSRTFTQEIPDGEYTEYTIRHANLIDWEMGFGLFAAAGPSIDRAFPIRSTNADAALNLTGGPHIVAQTATAMRLGSRGLKAFADVATVLLTSQWIEVIFQTPVMNTDNIWSAGAPTKIIPPPWARAMQLNAVARFDIPGTNSNYGCRFGVDGIPTDQIGLPQILLQNQTDPRFTVISGEVSIAGVTDFSLLMRQETGLNNNPSAASTWVEVTPIP